MLIEDLSSMESGKADQPAPSSASSSFPFGLHILVVDDDPSCLWVVEKMLRKCRYEVTTCEHATIALSLLRERRAKYDVVLTDVHMPDMDGFKLLEIVGLEMDLPVIMMSADCDVNVARRGLEHGACYYLMKPISIDEIKNIWQHLVRKKKYDEKEIGQVGSDGKEIENTGSVEEDDMGKKALEDAECASSVNEGSPRKQFKRKKNAKGNNEDDTDDDEEQNAQKKPRIIWHSELHSQFLTAVNHIGIDRAVPKKILELMDVPGLTRENVASHLQKYRMFLRRLNDVQQSQCSLSSAFPGKSKFGLIPHHMIVDYGLSSHPKFPDSSYNSMGSQPGVASNMQNQNASMPLTSINPMPLLNQTSQINNLMATLGFGHSTLNGPTNVAPQIQPGKNCLAPKPSPLPESDLKLRFGVVPEHLKRGPSSLTDNLSMAHQKTQANPGPFGSSPTDNFFMMNVQNSNNFADTGNAGLINRFKQASPFNQTSNYSGLHLSSSGGLHGMSQPGLLGQATSNINSGYNLLNEINKGKMPLDMDPKNPSLLPEFNVPDFSFDPFNKFSSPSPFPTSFPIVNQEPNDLLMEKTSKGGKGDTLEDILKSSRIGNNSVPLPFDATYLEDFVFKQQNDGLDPMESEFDISAFQMDGSNHAKGAPI